MQAKGRLQCWNADGQELGGSCREGCAGKGQAATLEQQRLTARLGGSCRAHLKPARKSSTPAVVPGAAPALAKAGVGGYDIGLSGHCSEDPPVKLGTGRQTH